MPFDPKLNIQPTTEPLGFSFGPDCFSESFELRRLDAIRQSLLDPQCDGPDPVYAISMDVGRSEDRGEIVGRNLLFGIVTYASGRLGQEPIRSQGHVHKKSAESGWSTPEVYEIWQGRAAILMQERDAQDPGRCFAVMAGPGDVVIVPPGWAHATISADSGCPLTFGAWCVRDYGFVYDGVRAHRGLAWYPVLDEGGALAWKPNPTYDEKELIVKAPEGYGQLGLDRGKPIYQQFVEDPDRFLFVPEPERADPAWKGFTP